MVKTLTPLRFVTAQEGAFHRALQRRATLWQPDDVIEVEGALQRRFWRTPTGKASVYEVNCRKGRKVTRAATTDARSA